MNDWRNVKTPVLRMVLKRNNLWMIFNNFQRKLLELQDKSSTLRINFLPQKKDEKSWIFVLHARIMWCRIPALLHLCLFIIDDKIRLPLMIVTYYMLPGLHLSQKVYITLARQEFSIAETLSWMNTWNLHELLVNVKVSRSL